MRGRYLGLFAAVILASVPAPAQAQGDFLKGTLKRLIERSGVYISTSTRTSIDNDVDMGPSIGIGFGSASLNPATGKKFSVGFSSYSANLETAGSRDAFGRFKAQQLMATMGYQWVRGKMIYKVQVGAGYSFNHVTMDAVAPMLFSTPDLPVRVDVSNSFVVKPQAKAEYFVHPKVSFRTQLSYTFTDPDVVVHTATASFSREWRPHHVQLSIAIGFFPFRK